MTDVSLPAQVFEDPFRPLVIDSGRQHVQVKLCLSPLCSTIASLIEASSGSGWTGPLDGWCSIVRRTGIELGCSPLSLYTRYPAIPRFLLPRLDDPAPAFRAQLDDIARSTDTEIRRDLFDAFGSDQPEPYRPFLTRPRQALAETVAALGAYHASVIAPRWATMRQVLERDVLRLAYVIATREVGTSLNRVHPAISYSEGLIRVAGSGGGRPTPSPLADRALLLTPLICDPQGVIADLGDRLTVKIGYAAPAARSVWSSRPDPALAPRRRLCELLGGNRAGILVRLDGPCTTTGLSQELRLAPSTVSEHIRHLCLLGLVAGTRQGRQVYYSRTGTGDGLLALFT